MRVAVQPHVCEKLRCSSSLHGVRMRLSVKGSCAFALCQLMQSMLVACSCVHQVSFL